MGYSTDIFTTPPPDGCICAVCHDVLKDASSFNCGHTFCSSCVSDVTRWTNSTCPNCRAIVSSSNPNYAVRDIIGALQVSCPFDDTECGWTGQVNEVAAHGNVCMYKTIARMLTTDEPHEGGNGIGSSGDNIVRSIDNDDAVMEDDQAAEETAPDERQQAENNESSEEADQNQEEVSGQDTNAADANDDNQDQQAMETDDAAPAADPSANEEAPSNEESNEAPSVEANNEASNNDNEASASADSDNMLPPTESPVRSSATITSLGDDNQDLQAQVAQYQAKAELIYLILGSLLLMQSFLFICVIKGKLMGVQS